MWNCNLNKQIVDMKDSSIVIPKGLKTDIIGTLADSMSNISAYHMRQHYENVAKAFVEKHPCLRDPGSEKRLFHSLKFKLGNYWQKLIAAGCPEVVINKRKAGVPKGKCVKKSKHRLLETGRAVTTLPIIPPLSC